MWLLGHDLHLVWAVLAFFTVFMVLYSGAIALLEPVLPTAVLELFRYGKALDGPVQSRLVGMISVPKSYFTHFYVFSSIFLPALLGLAVAEAAGAPPPALVTAALDELCTSSRASATSRTSALLALALLTLQSFRRLYECVAVNQPSKSTMNITHYIVGFAHYFCAGAGVVCEAPGFAPGAPQPTPHPALLLVLVLVFLWAWRQQLAAHRTFAQLKLAAPTKHGLPTGGLFEMVSCPHYTMEMVLYTVVALVLGPRHTTGLVLLAWVVVNQAIAGLMSHRWYLATFRDYPKDRRAVIPYIL